MDLDHLVAFYENLTPASLPRFAEFYSADARFRDPFNDVRGVEAITRVFAHMFHSVQEPRFVVTERVVDADGAFLVWEFHFRAGLGWRIRPQVIRGSSHLRFAADGRVCHHRDYWDANEELFMKLPIIGGILRWLSRQMVA